MSVRTMAKVWEQSSHAGTELLMLLAIADFADDEGNAYPSIGTLATKCRMTARNVNHIMVALRASGELEVLENMGPHGTNRYRITLVTLKPASPLKGASPLKPASSTPEAGFLKPLKPASDEPSLNHQEPPVSAKPRKAGRSKSEKKTFKAWYEAAKVLNPKVLPEDDPIHEYMTKVGMNYDFMVLHWHWFKAKQLASGKLQADWPQTFRNSVKGNYGRLWFRNDDGIWKLTTAGKQAALEHECDAGMSSGARDWTSNST